MISGFKAAQSQHYIMFSDADSLVRLGSDYIYNVQFDSARQCFNEVIERYPNHPAGYFLDAMVEWWKIWLHQKDYQWDDIFIKKINKVVDVCDRILDTNQYDLNAMFFKAGALGYRGRFYVVREKWLKAVSDGKTAYNLLQQCHRMAPGNHDIMLGTGIYNYFAAKFPEEYPIVKPLMKFFPDGDKYLGLLQLQAAARHARYAATEADVVRLQIYYQFEQNYTKTYEAAKKLFEEYPKNPYFHRYVGKSYIIKGRNTQAEQTWREILKRYIDKYPGYNVYAAREALYYIGYTLMRDRKYKDALKYFYKCDEACRKIDDKPSGFMVKLNLHIGKIYDRQGKRNLAIKQYKKVLDMREYDGSHEQADRYLENPYGQ